MSENQVRENPLLKIKTKKARVEFVKARLQTDDRWLIRGLVAIYRGQTSEEQNINQTVDHNGVGFGAFDAEFLTGMAKLVLDGRGLSKKQMDAVRKAMIKYAGQLVRISGAG
jgi:hypothetical protein